MVHRLCGVSHDTEILWFMFSDSTLTLWMSHTQTIRYLNFWGFTLYTNIIYGISHGTQTMDFTWYINFNGVSFIGITMYTYGPHYE